jgi:SAM-dependent methyltransferase
MKATAIDVFVCPACKGSFELRVRTKLATEILEGRLVCCGCRASYPITGGVPRFVADDAYAGTFGYQWNWFRTVQLDSMTGSGRSNEMLHGTTGWHDTEYRNRRLLDAGVGAGRFAEHAAEKGAEVFGIDLTPAVDAAYRNIGMRSNVHLAQADIFAPPFRAGTFDLAYSIGVLHHTPDPSAAFASLAPAVRPGGKLAVYLYSRYGSSHRSSDALRVLTTRLPLTVMWGLSAIAVPLYYLYRLPVVGKLANLMAPISMEPNWRWRWLDTFDWYTPKYQWKFLYPEVFRWFRDNGFEDVRLFDGPIRMSGQKRIAREPTREPLRSRHDLVAS